MWQSAGQDGSSASIVYQRFSALGEPLSTETVATANGLGAQQDPAIAATDDGGFVIVWEAVFADNPTSSDFGVLARQFGPDGLPAGDAFVVNTTNTLGTQFDPVVAGLSGGGFAVAFVDDFGDGSNLGIQIRFYDAAGVPSGPDFQVNTTTPGAQSAPAMATIAPSGAANGLATGGVVVVWQDGGNARAQVFDSAGMPVGGEITLPGTAGAQDAAVAGLTGGRFVAVWTENGTDGSATGVFGQVYEGDGTAIGAVFPVNVETAQDQFDPAVSGIDDGGFVVTWTSDTIGTAGDGSGQGVISRRFDATGTPVTGEAVVNQTTSSTQNRSDVAGLAGGTFVTVFESADADQTGVFQRISGDPALVLGLSASPVVEAVSTLRVFEENTVNAAPQRIDADGAAAVSDTDSADFDGGRLVVGVVAQGEIADGFLAEDAAAQDNLGLDTGPGSRVEVQGTDVLVDGVLVGALAADGTGGQALIVDLNASATADVAEILIEALTYQNPSDDPRASREIAIQLEDGDGATSTPVVVEIQVTPETDAVGKIRDEVIVNQTRVDQQLDPAVTTLFDPVTGAPSGYVVVWEARNQDQPGDFDFGIFAQRYDLQGQPLGAETQINVTTALSQFDPAVAGLTDGGYVIVWTSDVGDGSGDGVFYSRYDASGVLVPGEVEVQVNLETSSTQSEADVAALDTGGFQIVWTSANSGPAGDGSGTGIFTRRFDAAGVGEPSESRVNVETSGSQNNAEVTALSGGRAAIVYVSADSAPAGDGNQNGVFLRLVDAAGQPQGAEIQVNTFTAGAQQDPQIATLSDGNVVVVWASEGQDQSATGVYAQIFTDTGLAVTDEFRVADSTSGAQTQPDVAALADGQFVVSWTDTSFDGGSGQDVLAQVFDADGTRIDTEQLVNTNLTFTQADTAVAGIGGAAFVVVYDSNGEEADGFQSDVVAQIFGDPAEFDVSAAPLIDGLPPSVTIAEADANAGALIFPAGAAGIRDADSADFAGGQLTLSRVTADSNADDFIGVDTNAQDTLFFAPGSGVSVAGSAVSVDGVVIGTLISDGVAGADLTVGFNSDATLERVETLLSALSYQNDSDNPRASRTYTIDLTDGDGSIQTPTSLEIAVTQTDEANAIGVALPETQVNTFTAGAQSAPETAALQDGGWVVVWTSAGQDGDGEGVYLQRYNADGSLDGGEVRVSTSDAGAQRDASVAGLVDGGYVVVFESAFGDEPGSSDFGVLSQRYDANGDPVGGEVVVNTTTSLTQFDPKVAADPAGGYVVVWTTDTGDGNGDGVAYQRFDAAGVPSGGEVIVNQETSSTQSDADVTVLSTGQSLVVWTSATSGTAGDGNSNGVFARIVEPDGTVPEDEFQINQVTTGSQSTPKVVTTTTGFAVVWSDASGQDGSGTGVQIRFFDTSGAPLTDEFTVNENRSSTQDDPDIAVLADGSVLVTYETQDAPGGSGIDVAGQRFTASGQRIDGEFRVNDATSSSQTAPAISALTSGGFVVAYDAFTSGTSGDGSSTGVFQTVYGDPNAFLQPDDRLQGVPEAVTFAEAEVNAGFVRIDADKTIAVPTLTGDFDGGRLVIRIDEAGDEGVGFAAPDDIAQHSFTILAGGVGNGAVTVLGTDVLVDGVVVGTLTSNGQAGDALVVSLNANADAEAVEALLGNLAYANASDDPDDIRIAIDLSDGTGRATQTAYLDLSVAAEGDAGLIATAESRVNAHTVNEQTAPAIAELNDGSYVVVWESFDQDQLIPPTSADGVFGQRFSADGVPMGPEFQVNTTIAQNQNAADVAATADGGFVVVWTSTNQDSPGDQDTGVFAQRYNADGSANGGEIQINTSVPQSQFDAAVAGLPGGGFLVSFTSDTGDMSNDAILLQEVDATGALIGETVVNTSTNGNQGASDIAVLAGGGFVVTWTDFSAIDGSASSVRARVFDASGTALDTDFQVNTGTNNDQDRPAVTALDGGGFVIVWESSGQDGSSTGVYGQRYDATGGKVGEEFRVNDTTVNAQQTPDVAALDGGGFVVSWSGNGTGDTNGAFTQVYDASGARVDGETLVNVETASTQDNAAVLGLTGGGYKVVYTASTSGTSGDGASTGIFLRGFVPTLPADTAPVLGDVQRTIAVGADDVTAAPVRLDDAVAFTDPDTTDFTGAELLVYYAGENTANDQLSVLSVGDVSVAGTAISVGGTAVATIDGTENGVAGADLRITFNAAADAAAIQAVFEALAFASTETAAALINTDRSIGFLITDGAGGQTQPDTIFLDFVGGSVTPPALDISNFGDLENGQDNQQSLAPVTLSALLAGPVLLDTDIDFDNAAGNGFDGGTVRVTPSTSIDTAISLLDSGTGPDQIGFDGTTVTFEGVAIGTLDPVADGIDNQPFEIDLNAAATTEAVEALIEALTIALPGGVDNPSLATSITVQVIDDAGNTASTGFAPLPIENDILEQLTGEQQVNTFTSGDQTSPRIAELADGGYVVVWTSSGQDDANTTSRGIFAQRFDAFGAAVGGEFQVNDIDIGDQIQPRVTGLSTGEFVVAWTEFGRDGSINGVFVQRYTADGSVNGDVILANETTANSQDSAQISDLGGGRFLMTWVDSGADGNSSGIFGRVFDAAGQPEGGEFQINTSTSGTQNRPRTDTLPDGSVMVVWQDAGGADGSGSGVFAQRIDTTGALVNFDGSAALPGVSTEVQINTTTDGTQDRPDIVTLAPSATLPGGGFVVFWTSPDGNQDGIFAQVYALDGTAQGGEFRVNAFTGSNQADPVATGTADGGFIITWTDNSSLDGSGEGIVSQKFAPDGSVDGPVTLVNEETSSTQSRPEVATLNNGAVVYVWSSFTSGTAGDGSSNGVFQVIDGTPAPGAGAMAPVLAGVDGAVVFDEAAVNAGLQRIDADGSVSLTDMDSADFDGGRLLVTPIVLGVEGGNAQLLPADGAAQDSIGILAGGGVAVSGSDVLLDGTVIGSIQQDGTGGTLEVLFNADATAEGVERVIAQLGYANASDDPAEQRRISVQVSDGDGGNSGSAIIDITIVPEVDRLTAPNDTDAIVNSYTPGAQTNAAVATLFDPVTGAPAGYVIVWQSADQDRPQDTNPGIYAQIFALDGTPEGAEFRINDFTEFSQTDPEVVGLVGGGFVVGWTDDSFANPAGLPLGEQSTGVFGQAFDNNGSATGDTVLINDGTSQIETDVSLTALADGGFGATWTGLNSVFGRTFDANGTARGGEFTLPTGATSARQSDVTALANGTLAFVWSSSNQDIFSTEGVYLRITDGTGAEVLGETLVNTTVLGGQNDARVEALADGSFVVVWTDGGADGSSNGIFQQRYDIDGTAIGGEVRVNETTASSQSDAEIAALESGGWVVTWSDSSGQDGSGTGVFGQVFAADGTRVDGEFQVNSETASTQHLSAVAALAGDDFVVAFSSEASGTAGDGSSTAVVQRVFTDAAPAGAADPVINGLPTSIVLDEADFDAGLQGIFGNISLGDTDSADFAGGALTLAVLDNSTVQRQFAPEDGAAQDQLGLLPTGGVTVTGTTVRVDGVAIGTLESNGAQGEPLIIRFNAAAEVNAVEAVLEAVGYANTSDDPETARIISFGLTDGDGGAVKGTIDVAITPEDDAFRPVAAEVQTNSFTSGEQTASATATLFDPVTGAPSGYVITWTSTNQDATGDNDRGVFAQIYDISGAPVGGEFQVNTTTLSAQFSPDVIGLATGGFAIAWEDNSGTFESGTQIVLQVYDAVGQKEGAEIFVDAPGSSQADATLSAYDNGDFVVVRTAQSDSFPSQNTLVGQRFNDTGGTVGSGFVIEDLDDTAFNQPDVAVLADGTTVVAFSANGLESGGTSDAGVFVQLIDAGGAKIGSPVQVNTRETSTQSQPSIAALEGGGFVVIYESARGDDFSFTTSNGVYGQIFNAAGAPVGGEFLVNEIVDSTQSEPDVIAQPGGGFTVVFADFNNTDGSGGGVFTQSFDADGTRLDGQVQINEETSGTQDRASIAALGNGNYVVAYDSATSGSAGDGSGTGVFHRIVGDPADFNVGGTPVVEGVNASVDYVENVVNGIPQLIDADGAAAVSDADSTDFDGGTILVSNVVASAPLIDQINPPDDLTQDTLGLRQTDRITINGTDVSVDGALVGSIVQDGQDGRPFEIVLNANADAAVVELLVENLTYRNISDDPLETRQLRIQVTDGDGGAAAPVLVEVNIAPSTDAFVPFGVERQANTETTSEQDKPAITGLSDGGFVLVWESVGQDGSLEGIYGQRFDKLGNPVGRDGSALPSGDKDEFLVNTTTSSSQFDPAVTDLTDGGFLVTWTDASGLDGSGNGIFGQRFDAEGVAVASDGSALPPGASGEFQVNVEFSSTQDSSDAAGLKGPNAGSFVVVWDSNTSSTAGDTSGEGVFAQVYTPTPQGEIQVNTETQSTQANAQIVALSDGGFFVVWQSQATGMPPSADGSSLGVFGQRYDAGFTAVGGEVQINTTTVNSQSDPQVTELADGSLVVVWTSIGTDGSGSGVYAQILDPSGALTGEEFRVNDQRIGNQTEPVVTALSNGGFVVVWTDGQSTDGSLTGVFAKQYSATGARLDSQFQVNTEVSSGQFEPVVAEVEDGFVIAWTS
ncbi:MAG: hypothetical protein AAF281_00960, partial [Pseudomonadota bacterium]